MSFHKIIVLDPEMIIRKTLAEWLRKKRYSVALAETTDQAEALIQKTHFDLIFSEANLPNSNIIDFLKKLQSQENPPIPIIITANRNLNTAVECIKNGAFDYISKPFDINTIEDVLKKAEEHSKSIKSNPFKISEETNDNLQSLIVGQSEKILTLKKIIQKVGMTDATVLIEGENGTGKELIARELYKNSRRFNQPYVRVNCAAISESLIESEFFGHEKGAYTGATEKRQGRFEIANGGTILLDEISEISPKLQAKLLRVLQEKEFERVGGNKTINVDVRIIATTNRDLKKSVEEGHFREDLYYRLKVFPIYVPPLRERNKDILILADVFLNSLARKHNKKNLKFSKKTQEWMILYPWPGNVRELQNAIERAVILTDDNNLIEPISLALSNDKESSTSLASLHDMEKNYILSALQKAEGQRKKTAEMLDISIKTLNEKLSEYQDNSNELAS